jgi:hypothetical protein
VDGEERDGGDGCNHQREKDYDEPGCAIGGLWRGLSDAHGIDESVRDESDEVHDFPVSCTEVAGSPWLNRMVSSRIYFDRACRSGGGRIHLKCSEKNEEIPDVYCCCYP